MARRTWGSARAVWGGASMGARALAVGRGARARARAGRGLDQRAALRADRRGQGAGGPRTGHLVEAGRFDEYFDANVRLRMGEAALARLKARPDRYAEITGALRRALDRLAPRAARRDVLARRVARRLRAASAARCRSIAGSEDSFPTVDDVAPRWPTAIPGARLHVVAGGPHFPNRSHRAKCRTPSPRSSTDIGVFDAWPRTAGRGEGVDTSATRLTIVRPWTRQLREPPLLLLQEAGDARRSSRPRHPGGRPLRRASGRGPAPVPAARQPPPFPRLGWPTLFGIHVCQHPADAGDPRALLLLGQDPGAAVPVRPDRVRGRPVRLPRHRPGAAAGLPPGLRGLHRADRRAPGGAATCSTSIPRSRAWPTFAVSILLPGLHPGGDGGRPALPAQPDLVAGHPLLVPRPGRGGSSRSSSWARC